MENCTFGNESEYNLSGDVYPKHYLFGVYFRCSVIQSGTFLAPHWGAGYCSEIDPAYERDLPMAVSPRKHPLWRCKGKS